MLGADTMGLVLAGNAYSKDMMAHKLILQARWGLLMPIFLVFLYESHNECQVELSTVLADDKRERIPELVELLMQEQLRNLLTDFVQSKSEDVNFIFWWQYMDMISVLLLFT